MLTKHARRPLTTAAVVMASCALLLPGSHAAAAEKPTERGTTGSVHTTDPGAAGGTVKKVVTIPDGQRVHLTVCLIHPEGLQYCNDHYYTV